MTDDSECVLGYDHQEHCQRYNIIGCKGGKFAELDFKYTLDCKHLVKEKGIKND